MRLAAIVVLSGLVACADEEPLRSSSPAENGSAGAPLANIDHVDAGAASLVLTGDGGLALTLSGKEIARLPADAIELGLANAAADDETNYDPYPVVTNNGAYSPPDGLDFRAPTSSAPTYEHGSLVGLSLTFQDAAADLRIAPEGDSGFKLTITPTSGAARIAFTRVRLRGDVSEAFYGLGESYDHVNQRGATRAMQLETDGSLESSDNEAHVPIPFLIGTTGWATFVDSKLPASFEVATTEPDLVQVTVGTGTFSNLGLTFHLYAEAHPLDLPKHLNAATAQPKLPAPWALGPWIWRDGDKNQAEVEDDITQIRTLDLADTGVWVDNPYATAIGTFDFNPALYADPAAMVAKASALGFRTAVWHVPYVDEKAAASADLAAQVATNGYYPPTTGLVLNNWGRPLDFTNPDAVSFWQSHLDAYTQLGIQGFKLDYGEDIAPGITESRNKWAFFDQTDERTMHARYAGLYHQTYAQKLPADGGFLLCRHGSVGDQANGLILWPGDLDSSFAKQHEAAKDPNGKSYSSVGGLPASVIAGLSVGTAGFPFFGADTGGYRHAPPDDELFVRWFEQTALSTVMQVGGGASSVPWEVFGPDVLPLYRTYARLHLRLFPYEWTYANRLLTDGRPIARPFGLAYPEVGAHPDDEYLFGDDLLVAPVLERGLTARDLTLPPGQWVQFFRGEIVEGPGPLTTPAALGELPLFIRAGALVPMLRETIDTMSPVDDPSAIDSFATTPGPLYVRTSVGPATSQGRSACASPKVITRLPLFT